MQYLCNNDTQMILKCLDQMQKDGILKYIEDMEGLTTVETQYIKKILYGEGLKENKDI